MSVKKQKHSRGIILVPDNVALEGIAGELKVGLTSQRLEAYLEAAVREVITADQTQVLTNKTIDADLNPISNLETDNLKAGVLNTDLSAGATDTEIPSALAAKTYTDAAASGAAGALQAHLDDATDAHDASAISVVPTGNLGSTDVQSALVELQGEADLSNAHIAASQDVHGIGVGASVVGTTTTQTLTNKTLTGAILEGETRLTNPSYELSQTSLLSGTNGTITPVTQPIVRLTSPSLVNVAGLLALTSGSYGGVITLINETGNEIEILNNSANALAGAKIITGTDDNISLAPNASIFLKYNVTNSYYNVIGGTGAGGATVGNFVAGETLVATDQVYISTGTGNDSGRTAGQVYKVDATNDDRVEVLGFVKVGATAGNSCKVQVGGFLPGFTGLTPGRMYYASATVPGAITLTAPSANGQWVVSSALATSATTILINTVASASSEKIVDNVFTVANNQVAAANVTGLIFNPASFRGFTLSYSIYRQADTALSAVAQVGQLRAAYNTQSNTWYLSDDFTGQNAGVTFSILASGQIQYTSTSIAGANYVGTLRYTTERTFKI